MRQGVVHIPKWAAILLMLSIWPGVCFAVECPHCGAENPDVATFCRNCGRELRGSDEPSHLTDARAKDEARRAAEEAFAAREWEEALAYYRALLSLDPADSVAVHRISVCKDRIDTDKPSFGRARILTEPAGARIAVDGAVIGVSPLTDLDLYTGTRIVSLDKKCFERWTGILEVFEKGTSLLDVKLREKSKGKAFARSLFFPGQGQRYRERPAMGWIYTLATVGAVGASVFLHTEYDEAYDSYKNAKIAYDEAISDHDRLWEQVQTTHSSAKQKKDNLLISVSAAAGIYVFNLLDSLLF